MLANIGVKTPDELARYAKDTLKRLDPDGVGRRARKAREQADVTFHPAADGMGDVIVHEPIEDAALFKTATDAYAAAAKQCGDDRPIGVMRAEAPTKWASNYLPVSLTGTCHARPDARSKSTSRCRCAARSASTRCPAKFLVLGSSRARPSRN